MNPENACTHCPDCGTSFNFSMLVEFAELRENTLFVPARIGSKVVVLAGNPERDEEFSMVFGRIYHMESGMYNYMTPDGKMYSVPSNRVVTLSEDDD